MAKLSGASIGVEARKLIAASSVGLRWSEIVGQIAAISPETTADAVQGALHKLVKQDPTIARSKGIYSLAALEGTTPPEPAAATPSAAGPKEEQFYRPLADWIVEMQEATHAVPVGGNLLKSKWGTPDIVGVLRPLQTDPIKFEPRVVAIEVKLDPAQSVTAFGQAVAYRLFAHRCYLAMPKGMAKSDLGRLEALAGVHGIGLILFDKDPRKPDIELQVRAVEGQPDITYMTEAATKLAASKPLAGLFG